MSRAHTAVLAITATAATLGITALTAAYLTEIISNQDIIGGTLASVAIVVVAVLATTAVSMAVGEWHISSIRTEAAAIRASLDELHTAVHRLRRDLTQFRKEISDYGDNRAADATIATAAALEHLDGPPSGEFRRPRREHLRVAE